MRAPDIERSGLPSTTSEPSDQEAPILLEEIIKQSPEVQLLEHAYPQSPRNDHKQSALSCCMDCKEYLLYLDSSCIRVKINVRNYPEDKPTVMEFEDKGIMLKDAIKRVKARIHTVIDTSDTSDTFSRGLLLFDLMQILNVIDQQFLLGEKEEEYSCTIKKKDFIKITSERSSVHEIMISQSEKKNVRQGDRLNVQYMQENGLIMTTQLRVQNVIENADERPPNHFIYTEDIGAQHQLLYGVSDASYAGSIGATCSSSDNGERESSSRIHMIEKFLQTKFPHIWKWFTKDYRDFEHSGMNSAHLAVIVGDRGGPKSPYSVIASATNKDTNGLSGATSTHSGHAEMEALNNATNGQTKERKFLIKNPLSLFVMRFDSKGSPACSRPCRHCSKSISQTKLNIRRVHYTNEVGEWESKRPGKELIEGSVVTPGIQLAMAAR